MPRLREYRNTQDRVYNEMKMTDYKDCAIDMLKFNGERVKCPCHATVCLNGVYLCDHHYSIVSKSDDVMEALSILKSRGLSDGETN